MAALEQLARIFNAAIQTKDPTAPPDILTKLPVSLSDFLTTASPTKVPAAEKSLKQLATDTKLSPGVSVKLPPSPPARVQHTSYPAPIPDTTRQYDLRSHSHAKQSTTHYALTLDAQPLLLPHNIHPLPHAANTVVDLETGRSLEYCDLIRNAKTKKSTGMILRQ
jgi:hypothetical protein